MNQHIGADDSLIHRPAYRTLNK